MRRYPFLVGRLKDFESAGFRVLTPETAQRYALQTEGEYPEREAILHPLGDDVWQVMPVTERDWYAVLSKARLACYEGAKEFEDASVVKATDTLYSKDSKGDTVGERRLPCVIGSDDPVRLAADVIEIASTKDEPTKR